MSKAVRKKNILWERNKKLANVEAQGEKYIKLTFAGGGSARATQQTWYFMWQLHRRCTERFGADIRNWPKYMWVKDSIKA